MKMTTEPGDRPPSSRKEAVSLRKTPKPRSSTGKGLGDRKLAPFDLESYLLSPKVDMTAKLKNLSLRAQRSKLKKVDRKAAPSMCQLQSFQNPLRAGVIPGLDWDDGQVHLHPTKWPCCQGHGSQYQSDTNVTVRCSLQQRFLTLQRLIEHFIRWNPTANMMEILAPTKFNPVLQQLSLIANKQSSQGMVFWRDSEDQSFARFFWAAVFTAPWRFGLNIILRDLSKPNPVTFSHYEGAKGGDGESILPTLLMVYNISDLWSPATYEALDYLVTYAYNGCLPLFLEIKPLEKSSTDLALSETGKPKAKVQTGRQGFSALIKAARLKTVRTSYPPGFLSKLRTVTKGLPRGIFD